MLVVLLFWQSSEFPCVSSDQIGVHSGDLGQLNGRHLLLHETHGPEPAYKQGLDLALALGRETSAKLR